MQTSATNRKIRTLLSDIQRKVLIPRPEFQRRLVWSNKHKSAFIETVLCGYPFPEIYIAAGKVNTDTGEGTEMLVDGQQRVTTLKQYFQGSADLKLSREILPYSELGEKAKTNFLEYEVVVRDLGNISMAEIKQVFQRINSTNYALNAMEVHNARFDGEMKQFAEKLAQHKFFDKHRVFRAHDMRRMSDTSFALSLIITVMSTYFHRENELENYLHQYNDAFEEKELLKEEFSKIFVFIDKCRLPQNSRAWRKTDLFTLLVEIYRVLIKENKSPNPTEVGKRLRKFYMLVNSIRQNEEADEKEDIRLTEYYTTTRRATSDRANRINRGKILREVINGEFMLGEK